MSKLANGGLSVFSDGRIFVDSIDIEMNIKDIIDIKNIIDNFEKGTKDYFQGNIKEKKKMEILKIYNENRINEINEYYETEREKIIENDEIQKIKDEAKEKMKDVLELDEDKEICVICSPDFTKNTQNQLIALHLKKAIKLQNLDKLIREIEAQLEIAPDYETKMKIMKDYGVIDKKTGKII